MKNKFLLKTLSLALVIMMVFSMLSVVASAKITDTKYVDGNRLDYRDELTIKYVKPNNNAYGVQEDAKITVAYNEPDREEGQFMVWHTDSTKVSLYDMTAKKYVKVIMGVGHLWFNLTPAEKLITGHRYKVTIGIGAGWVFMGPRPKYYYTDPSIRYDIEEPIVRTFLVGYEEVAVEQNKTTTNTSASTSTSSGAKSSTSNKTVTIYAPDGRYAVINESELKAYLNVGWYKEPVVKIYASGGRSAVIYTRQLKAYLNVGWSKTPVK